jgi:hypothetical protein
MSCNFDPKGKRDPRVDSISNPYGKTLDRAS